MGFLLSLGSERMGKWRAVRGGRAANDRLSFTTSKQKTNFLNSVLTLSTAPHYLLIQLCASISKIGIFENQTSEHVSIRELENVTDARLHMIAFGLVKMSFWSSPSVTY